LAAFQVITEDLAAVNAQLISLEKDITAATEKHNAFLKELGLPSLPLQRCIGQ
jgi:thiol:disulfide interchange protein